VLTLGELTAENMGIETFINTRLNAHIANHFSGCTFVCAPDPAGFAKQQLNEMSLVDSLKRAGFKCVRPPTNDPEKRVQGVERLLNQQLEGKAMYLIDIYKHFTLAGIDGASAQVAAMGWTKAKTIAKLLTVEGADTDELIELANNNTVTDLSEAIKEQVKVGGTPGERKTRITLKFRYFEEEAATINGVLAAAQEQLGLKDIGEALAHIVTEWASEHGGGTATKAAAPTQRAAAAKKAAPAAKRVAAKA
jgi:hypothetical protein